MMRKLILFTFTILLSTIVLAETIVFGIVPQQSAQLLAKNWGPVISAIKADTGLNVVFATAPDIPEFEARLHNGDYDIAYMNPYHYTLFSNSPGYRAIAKAENKKIKGIIVTRQNSPIKTIADLQGRALAFPAPRAFAATMIPLAGLAEQGITVIPKFVKTHDSVYLTVERGLYEAGGAVVRTYRNMPTDTQNNLRILWESEGYTPHAIAVGPDMSEQTADALRTALIRLKLSEEGQKTLKPLGITGFESANDSDWDDVRSLNISQPE